jgi:two-component system OmpR family sensor kinase/two-component system sensor histidine kinase BaeS
MISRINASIPLSVKLIGAFALVIILGGTAAYWLTDRALRENFQVFSTQSGLIHAYQLQQPFADYYEQVGSWHGIENFAGPAGSQTQMGPGMMQQMSPAMLIYHYDLILADHDGTVLLAPDSRLLGQRLPEQALIDDVPINVAGRRVGTLLAGSMENAFNPLDQAFLSSISRSVLTASLIAALAALIVGALLLRQLTQPLRRLARATEQIASGNSGPGPRLPVHSRDELGQLTASFNRMAERLEKSEQLRRQMVADIAHELRTPLTVIQGDLQAIREGVFAPTPEAITSIHEESLRLNRLVNDLKELSLAEAEELTLNCRPTNINELIRQTATVTQPQLESKGIKLNVELPDEPVTAEVDSDRVGQVLVNLLSNAQRYTPEGGEIAVRLRRQGGKALVSVSDAGPGIAPDDLPYVFERFWRADRSRARVSGGSGLGLAIAKQLVEAHGGQIWAESSPGHGATFTFTLPLEDEMVIFNQKNKMGQP